MENKIICADALETLKTLQDNRVEWSKLELLRKNSPPEIYTKLKLMAA